MKHRTCPACSEGVIVDTKRAGRRMPFKNIPDLEVPEDISIPTCSMCGEEWLDAAASARVDDAMKAAYNAALPVKVEAALAKLTNTGVTQQQLERLLGLSVGYISKVKSGKETNPQLVATLMLLASDPIGRVAELKQLWRVAPKDEAGIMPADPQHGPFTCHATVFTPTANIIEFNRRPFGGFCNVQVPASPTEARRRVAGG